MFSEMVEFNDDESTYERFAVNAPARPFTIEVETLPLDPLDQPPDGWVPGEHLVELELQNDEIVSHDVRRELYRLARSFFGGFRADPKRVTPPKLWFVVFSTLTADELGLERDKAPKSKASTRKTQRAG